MLKKIAILGPESTGKSQLAEELAAFYDSDYAVEFARNYLSGLGRPYNQNDLLTISKKQQESIQLIQSKTNEYLFADTEMIVMKIWSEYKYNSVHPWIIRELENQDFNLYLLMDIDLPWAPDPLREHPNQREILFDLYEKELKKRDLPYLKISGQGKERILNAIKAIDNFFEQK